MCVSGIGQLVPVPGGMSDPEGGGHVLDCSVRPGLYPATMIKARGKNMYQTNTSPPINGMVSNDTAVEANTRPLAVTSSPP